MEAAGSRQSRMGLHEVLEAIPPPISSADGRRTISRYSSPFINFKSVIMEGAGSRQSRMELNDIHDANPPMNISSDAERSSQSASTDNVGDTNFGKADCGNTILEDTNFVNTIFDGFKFGKAFLDPGILRADSVKSSERNKESFPNPNLRGCQGFDVSDEFYERLAKGLADRPPPESEFAVNETRSEQHANCPPHECHAKNLGTCIAISGANYCLIATDKMSTGSSLTSDSKITKISETMVMASSAPEVEVRALIDLLKQDLKDDGREMTNFLVVQYLWGILYRMPYFRTHNFNVFVGLDMDGKGSIFALTGAGFFRRVGYISEGSGSTSIKSLLYKQLKSEKPCSTDMSSLVDVRTTVSESEAIDLVKTAFATATKRAPAWEIDMGDMLEIVVLKPGRWHHEFMDLRKYKI